MLLDISFPRGMLETISNALCGWVLCSTVDGVLRSCLSPHLALKVGVCPAGGVGLWHCLHFSGSSSFLPALPASLPKLLPFRNGTAPLSRFPIFLSPWILLYQCNGDFFFHFNLPGHLCCPCSLSPYYNFHTLGFFFPFCNCPCRCLGSPGGTGGHTGSPAGRADPSNELGLAIGADPPRTVITL